MKMAPMVFCQRTALGLMVLLMAAIHPVWATDMAFVTIEAAPWAYRDAQGNAVGAFPEIVAELERRTGIHLATSLYPLARVDHAMQTGSHDCTIILWNAYREPYVVRGEEVYPMPFGVISRKEVRLERYEDLAPLTISVTRGLALNPRFDADASLRKEGDKDYLTGIRKVVNGRSDAVAGALPTILYIASQHSLDQHLGAPLTLGRIPLTLQCSRQSRQIGQMPQFNETLHKMRADGSLARILARHGYR